MQISVCHSHVGPFVIAAEPYSNQDNSLGGDFPVWFPWIRLLQEPQLPENVSSAFHGVTVKLSSSPLSSPGTSLEI